ncbi:MAG: DUF2304 domain-containing protein [Candidatus Omnitrophica bacterium]|nr:DUF2304 domain-containing protein [Candidatus Omnitrophota bacterium]
MTEIYFHIFEALATVLLFGLVSQLVHQEVLRDKYGLGWTVVTALFLFRVIYYPSETGSFSGIFLFWRHEVILFTVTFVAIVAGTFLTVVLTRYSKDRRESIQELALLRFEMNSMLEPSPAVKPIEQESVSRNTV